MKKTKINTSQLHDIADHIGLDPYCTSFVRISEGQESEAFLLCSNNKRLVLRVNRDINGFLKDKVAHERFSTPELAIPRVVHAAWYDTLHAYCASELASGFTVQDADHMILNKLATLVDRAHENITKSKPLGEGYGPFDPSGNAPFQSWNQYLRSSIECLTFPTECPEVDLPLIRMALNTYDELVDRCPEIRCLVHADFGANNLLTNGRTITGVIDWETALYGDPIYDVAIASVWAFHLKCMEVQFAYWEVKYSGIENYAERILCYQIKLFLEEIAESA